MKKSTSLVWFAALLVPIAMAVACGSDDSNADNPSTGGTGGATGGASSGGASGSGGTTGGTAGTDAASGGSGGSVDASADAPSDAPGDVQPDADPACATIPKSQTVMAHLRITADNECEVWVNGTSVGTTNNWGTAVSIDVSLYVHPSIKNVIAVKGTNTSSQAGNDRGIIGELTILENDAPSALILTDASWRTSKTEVTGWDGVSFDDSSWTAATEIANHGDPPWGAVMTTTGAKWIWSGPVPADTANKPNLESAYARRVFYFSTTGAGTTDAPGCP